MGENHHHDPSAEINKALLNTNSARGVLTFCEWSQGEFDVVNAVTAVHRLAKAPDRRFVSKDSRYPSVIGKAHQMVVNTCGVEDAWPKLSKEHLLNAAWSFSMLNHRDDYLFDCICKEILLKPKEIAAVDLASMTRAMANLMIQNEPVMDKVCEMALKQMATFRPAQLSSMVWSFATLSLKDDDMMNAISKESISKIRYFQPSHLTQTGWAFAKLSVQNAALSGAMTDATIGRVDEFHAKDVAKIAWSFAELGAGTEAVMEVIAENISMRLNELDPDCLECIAHAFAIAERRHDEMFSNLTAEILNRVHELNPQHLSVIAWSYASLGLQEEMFIEAMRGEIDSRAGEFRAIDLAKMISAFMIWGTKDEAFAPLFEATMERIDKFSPRDLASVALAIEAVGVREFLDKFLRDGAHRFSQVSEYANASHWVEFSTLVASHGDEHTIREFEPQFKGAVFKPLLQRLHAMTITPTPPIKPAESFDAMQEFVKLTQLPHLGPLYTREALLSLFLPTLSSGMVVGMSELRAVAGPCSGTWDLTEAVAAASWDLQWRNEQWVEPCGRFFSPGPGRKRKTSLLPQLQNHRVQAERHALVHLVLAVLRKCEDSSELKECMGHVQILASQFLSIGSLCSLCQFRQYFSGVRIEVEFDTPRKELQ